MPYERKIALDYKTTFELGKEIQFKLSVSTKLGFVRNPVLWFNRNGHTPGSDGKCELSYDEELSNDENSVFVGSKVFDTTGYISFYCKLIINDQEKYVVYDYDGRKAELTSGMHYYGFFEGYIYQNSFRILKEAQGGIGYQIFLDTFNRATDICKENCVDWNTFVKWKPDADGEYRNNQFYGGDLRGVIEKIPYILSFGTTVVYISPIFKSPSQNRYDSLNYSEIDPMLGTYDDLDELHRKLNEVGVALIIDVAFNHSSNQSNWINENPEMYQHDENGELVGWYGFKALTQYNQENEHYIEKLNAACKLLEKYCDGLRIDLGDALQLCTVDRLNIFFPKYLMAEQWKHAVKGDFRDSFNGHRYDGAMNYRIPNGIYRYILWGNPKDFVKEIDGICKLYPSIALNQCGNFLSSHDTPRPLSILRRNYMREDRAAFENTWDMEKCRDFDTDDKFDTLKFRTYEYEHDEIPKKEKEELFKQEKLVRFLQYTFPGYPYIFAGDEMGVTGYKDPFNRKPMPWGTENEEGVKERLEFYREIGKFRISNREIFADSENFEILFVNEEFLIYRRDKMIFLLNRTDRNIRVPDISKCKIIYSAGEELVFISQDVIPAYTAIAFYEN